MQRWVRQAVLRQAQARGVERQLRAVQFALASRDVRRNHRDDEALRLLIRLCLPVDGHCVDVGANVGAILSTIVEAAPQGRHIAYEPLPELAAGLAERFPQVDVRAAALARQPGTRTFVRVLNAHTRSGFHPTGYDASPTETLAVPVEALDVSLPNWFAPALVKIDVEGAELEVIEGGVDLLHMHRPIVALEHGGPAGTCVASPDATRRIWQVLCRDVGLRAFDLDGDRIADERALLARVASRKYWNFIFHR